MNAPPCPACGRPLQAVALNPDTAPWLCRGCARGWWQAEIDAAKLYEPARQDFGRGTAGVLKAALDERAAARTRGTSGRPDSLPLLPTAVLTELQAQTGVATAFLRQVAAEQKRRGGKP